MPRLVTDEYSELLHYTTAAGLAGILSTGCFWATHASFLNDAEELSHFFDARLQTLAREAIYAMLAERTKARDDGLQVQGEVEQVVHSDAVRVADLLKRATLGFHSPFVFSMSAARDEKVARGGLLSQWRGYGVDGGYALVLDTRGFDALLKAEGEKHHYQFAQWGDVYYYGAEGDQPSSEEVAEYEATVRTGVVALVRGEHPDTVEGLYNAVTSLSCLYKHWGFAEEQEVRVIAIPPTADVAEQARAGGDSRLRRPTRTFLRGSIPVPYIELLAGLETSNGPTRLPIKRVIVGPHRDKLQRAEAVKHLLMATGYDAEVVCSEIPYIGR